MCLPSPHVQIVSTKSLKVLHNIITFLTPQLKNVIMTSKFNYDAEIVEARGFSPTEIGHEDKVIEL